MAKFLICYTLAGGIEIEAETKEEAINEFLGDGEFEDNPPVSDVKMIEGISRSFGYIDGDAIGIEMVEELKEEN